MIKWTPGPWSSFYNNSDNSGGGQWFDICGRAGERLFHFPYNAPEEVLNRCMNDAALAAAAPEMYDALKALAESPNTFSSHDKARAEELLARINGDEK